MGFVTRVIGRRVKKALDEFVETPQAQTAIAQAKRQMAVASSLFSRSSHFFTRSHGAGVWASSMHEKQKL